MSAKQQEKKAAETPKPEVGTEELHPFIQFVVEKRYLLITIGVVVLVAFAGVFGYSAWQKSAMRKAAAELGQLAVKEADQAKLTALMDFYESAPEVLKTQTLLEAASVCQELKDYAKAAELWEKLEGAEDADLAVIASLGRAKALGLDGKHDQALAVLNGIKDKAPESYTMSVYRALAQEAEEAKEWDIALAAYEQLMLLESDSEKQYIENKIAKISVLAEDNGS